MMTFLGKITSWFKGTTQGPDVCEYGAYLYRPVIQRAVANVMGLSEPQLVSLIDSEEVQLNNLTLDKTHLVLRLESGQYEIKIPSQNRIWRFFIN
jgi:hypothetical protein